MRELYAIDIHIHSECELNAYVGTGRERDKRCDLSIVFWLLLHAMIGRQVRTEHVSVKVIIRTIQRR